MMLMNMMKTMMLMMLIDDNNCTAVRATDTNRNRNELDLLWLLKRNIALTPFAFEVSTTVSGYVAGSEKHALEVLKQTSACTGSCGDQFDISPTGTRHCIVVNSLFLSPVFESWHLIHLPLCLPAVQMLAASTGHYQILTLTRHSQV